MKKQRGEVATAVLGVILLFAAGVAGLGPKVTQFYTDLCESAGYTYYPEAPAYCTGLPRKEKS